MHSEMKYISLKILMVFFIENNSGLPAIAG